MARLPSRGMMNDSDEVLTFRGGMGIPCFPAMSKNMRPSQSSATEVRRSGTMESFAQQNAAVTALPPKETAYSDMLLVAGGQAISQEGDVDVGLADEKCPHGQRC